MVVLSTSDEWQRQSAQLLQGRPTTTRITTKYNIPNLDAPKYQKALKRKREGDGEEKDAAPKVAKAYLTLKTYDPESGVVLKFKTDRAAEVGRLINGLGRLGRHMAALPIKDDVPDVVMAEAEPIAEATAAAKAAPGSAPTDSKAQPTASGGSGGAGSGKKKKKNKK